MKVELWIELHCCYVMVQRLLGEYNFNVRVFGEQNQSKIDGVVRDHRKVTVFVISLPIGRRPYQYYFFRRFTSDVV